MTLSLGNMTYNGVTLGPGGLAQIVSVDGLTGLPVSRNGDVGWPNDQGMLAGYDFMGNRPVTLKLEVTATAGNTLEQNLTSLRQAFLMNTTCGGGVNGFANGKATPRLTYNLGEGSGGVGVNRTVTARCRKFDVTVDAAFVAGNFTSGIATIDVLLDAVDPRIYDAATQTASVGLTQATGGLTFPLTFPVSFGSQSGGFIFAVNSGSYTCQPYITITGPCLNPRIEQQTTGVTVEFITQLNSGDSLVVDCYAGTAILNGTAGRLNTLAPGSNIKSLTIPPGTNTLAFFSDDSVSTAAQMTVAWANTWV